MINLYKLKLYMIKKLIRLDCKIDKFKNIIFFLRILSFSLNMIKIYKNQILKDYYPALKIRKKLEDLGGVVWCLLRYIIFEN